MDGADLNLACAWALVDGLVAGGVRDACVSPGSRSTPLALALARHPEVTVHVHLDERSSGFFALGLARATGSPVALACTSGTAAAEYLPAVVEASQSRVALVALTADRPPRLRGTGANQTIDQVGLYGDYARSALDLPLPEAAGQEAWWRQAAREALEAAFGDPPGPVHVNCPFEEPLSPSADAGLPAPTGEALDLPQRPDAELTVEEADRLAELVSGARGAVLIGGWPGDLSDAARFWAQECGWPVIAEPTSGVHRPGVSLGAGRALLATEPWIARRSPDVVIQLGAAPTSRPTHRFITTADRLVVADRWHLDADADRLASWRIAVDAEALTHALRGHAGRPQPPPADWSQAWLDADRAARAALDDFLDGVDEPFEPRIARDVAAAVPDGGTLFVGNSSPVRDLDLAMAPREGLRVLANRGASGIDGLVSTALGIAAGGPGPTVALLGDLSFLYDLGTVAWNARRGLDATVVVVRNGGGELFSQLPQAELPERELFVTPHEADLGALTLATGAGHRVVEHADAVGPALTEAVRDGGLQVVEVAVDAAGAGALRAGMGAAIAAAVG